MNAKQDREVLAVPAGSSPMESERISAHDAFARPQDEGRLLMALIQVLRRKRECMLRDSPFTSPEWLAPIWPPLIDALGRHTQRRRAAGQLETDPELCALANTLRLEFDALRQDVQTSIEAVRHARALQRTPLRSAYAPASAAPHSLGRG